MDDAGPVLEPLAPADPEAIRRAAASFGLGAVEVQVLVDRHPLPGTHLCWLVERCARRAVSQLGATDAPPGQWPRLPPHVDPCFWLHVAVLVTPALREWQRSRGVPAEVVEATLGDIGRRVAAHVQQHGTVGYDPPWWLGLTLRGGLYELGRLQFAPYQLSCGPAGPRTWYRADAAATLGAGFRRGDAALDVHVPAGAPLSPVACDASLLAARGLFGGASAPHLATCTSWLLDEQLAQYLPANSNVLTFQRRFTLVPAAPARDASDDIAAFVFGRRGLGREELMALRVRTRLERAIVQHVQDGGTWRVRTGWLELRSAAT